MSARELLVQLTGVQPVEIALIAVAIAVAALALILFDMARAVADKRHKRQRAEFIAELNDVLWGRAASGGDVRQSNVIRFPEHGKGE